MTPKLFGKWEYDNCEEDLEDFGDDSTGGNKKKRVYNSSLVFKDHIAFTSVKSQVFVPHTAGKYQILRFRKTQCPIVERLVDALMFHGRNCGKKLKACLIVQQTFEIMHLQTDGKNPLGVFIKAVKTGGPREDSQRIGKGGSIKRQSVDVSPMRRVCQSVYLMCVGIRK